MKRRRFLTAAAAAPAVPAALAQQQGIRTQGEPDEGPKLEFAAPDAVAAPVLKCLNAAQFAALQKLGELIMPANGKLPGALETKSAEFLDFWISQSPADKLQLYKSGLDNLNSQARKKYQKQFAELDATQADALLAPLRAPWSDPPPSDTFARFLLAAKQDIRNATMNSKEYSAAASSGTRRGGGGMGLYWNPIV